MSVSGLHPALEPADDLDWARLEAFVGLGLPEDERLDYKERVGSSVLETAAAMANTRGGTILVGVSENATIPNTPGRIVGVAGDPQGAVNNTNWSYCSPGVPMRLLPLRNTADGTVVLVIAVAASSRPPHWHRDKGVLIRSGDQNRPAPPELLDTWYASRAGGNPSESALRARAGDAAYYGSPGFAMHVWPVGALPATPFTPETDEALVHLASGIMRGAVWEGRPSGSEYVLESAADAISSEVAVAEQHYVRIVERSNAGADTGAVQFAGTLASLFNEYVRSLVFAERALEEVCHSVPPYRVELILNYAPQWVIRPPTGHQFRDPVIPEDRRVEVRSRVEITLAHHGAAPAGAVLVTGTLRRLGWVGFDSVVDFLTANAPAQVAALYE